MNSPDRVKLIILKWQNLSRKTKVSLFLVALLIVILPLYMYNFVISPTFVMDGVRHTRNWKGEIVQSEEIIDNAPENIVRAKVTEDIDVKSWEIVDTSQTPPFPTGIYYYEDQGTNDVLKWNKYLLGFTRDYFIARGTGGCIGGCGDTLQSTIRHIRILNMTNDEVYSISLQKPTWGGISVISPQIVDNTYFLTVGDGGPRSAPFQYRLQLPPGRNSRVEKLEKTIGSNIYKYGNVYITSSCYEGCYYQRVNMNTLATTELERLNAAANTYISDKPEELIGFTDQGEMVIKITSSGETMAVSLLDEKTTRKLQPDERVIEPYKDSVSQTVQDAFEALDLDDKYILMERNAKYQTSYIKTFNKSKLPQNAEIVE